MAPALRNKLIFLFNTAMTFMESGQYAQAKSTLQNLQQAVTQTIKDPNQTALNLLISAQLAKFP